MDITKKNRRHYNHKVKTGESPQNQTHYYEWKESEHPGCELSGFLMLDRVPGNFFMSRANHDLEPQLTNTSHIVNTHSIGHPWMHRLGGYSTGVQGKLRPMNGNDMSIRRLNYIKVIIII